MKLYAFYKKARGVPQVAEKFGLPLTTVYHLFDRERLKCRQWRGGSPKRITLVLIQQMHADYMLPMSLKAVGRKYGRCGTQIRDLFVSRGFSVRPFKTAPYDPKNGQVLPFVPKTPAELEVIIQNLRKIRIPDELRLEWRHWSFAKRGRFIEKVRRRLKSPKDRPSTPISKNVRPFDYASAEARAIADKINAGLPSRFARVKIDLVSQGVIYNGQLWFWCPKTGYQRGPWTPEQGRPLLHRTIWEAANGREIMPGFVVRFADGNPNNFEPNNLILRSRDDVLRETQARMLLRNSRNITALLLERSQQKKGTDYGFTGTIKTLKKAA